MPSVRLKWGHDEKNKINPDENILPKPFKYFFSKQLILMIQHLDKVLFCKLKWKVLCRFALCNMHFARIKSQRSKLFCFRNKINVESQNCRHYSRAINWICTISRFLQLNFIWFFDFKNQGLWVWSHKNKTDKILLI